MTPVIPLLRSHAFDDPAWLFEPKYDGFRGLVYLSRRTCLIRSRRGSVFKRFASLSAHLAEELEASDAILDGEVLALSRVPGLMRLSSSV